MSFFSSIRGFGRSSKKNKQTKEQTSVYSGTANGSALSLGTSHSSNKLQQSSSLQKIHQQSQEPNQSRNVTQAQETLPLFLYEPFVRTALVKGSFKTIVQLPKFVDPDDWIAVNIFEFYNNLKQFYGVFAEYIKPEDFPKMSAGPNIDYLWMDQNGKTLQLPANQYIEFVLSWIDNKIMDQGLFPTKDGAPFPPNFMNIVKGIARQMFRVYAHIYHNHFDKILHLSLEAHWNSFFAHFVSFAKEFNLIEDEELVPLALLIDNFKAQGKIV